MINLLKRIKLENIKGKQNFEVTFNDLTANQPNIIVAPNGYGKSTIATALKASTNGKLKLDINDVYMQDINNIPKLEIELYGDNSGVYVSTSNEGHISRNMSVYVINSSLYAKNTSRSFGGSRISNTADLRVKDIVIFDQIPQNESINYSCREMRRRFENKGKLFLNISSMLTNADNLAKLIDINSSLRKCIEQVTIQNKFKTFINDCSTDKSATEIKREIPESKIDEFKTNQHIKCLFECIEKMDMKPSNWQNIDIIFTAIQICSVLKNHYDINEKNILKNAFSYLKYKETKTLIDNRLEEFNTTGRNIKTHEERGKLIVKFERATSMSNGERDILSFIVQLSKFEISFSKNIGILAIDDVFDYLDGSNMLAVQYYLSETINKCKEKNKILFPIIFTHLDPDVFSNYYFKKKKVHYISFASTLDLNTDIVKMLRLREKENCSSEKEIVEKYYIHYIDEDYSMDSASASKISSSFNDSNITFRNKLYDEIKNKYLTKSIYNPIMIIAGLRIKIEEIIYQRLSESDREKYINTHTVINKLNYAVDRGIEVPELFFLLQPLYNDGLHLSGKDEAVRSKIKSCYLKTNNLHIRRMIAKVFEY